ncbi:MAG: hypothetical protein GEV06_27330 [Luteitalea sp.]|nr:hypothetical protein [Luteitalea sp.]
MWSISTIVKYVVFVTANLLLTIIDQAYDRQSWHGTNLRGSLRRVSMKEARWRPGRNRHNIWETVVHCAYWKYAVRRRLTGEKRGSFPLKGSNWFQRPEEGTDAAWRADIQLLDETHRSLRSVIETLDPGHIERAAPGGKTNPLTLITGMAAHDLYHAGQIQLLKRLAKKEQ